MSSSSTAPLPDLRSASQAELADLLTALDQPAYRAAQVFRWVHRAGVTSIEQMTNLPKALRADLAQRTRLTTLAIDTVQHSRDGTRKLRLHCGDGQAIESVIIPRDDKGALDDTVAADDDAATQQRQLTLCISSQVGCALGCRFCATATLGLQRNLTSGEIVDQVYRARTLIDPSERISNLVFMGMGEPLANLDHVLSAIETLCAPEGLDFSPRRMTVSTVGLVPKIVELGQRNRNVGLAISLHATDDELRSRLMPVNRRWPLDKLMQALRNFPLPRRRRITFEYIVLAGLNDTPTDVKRLPRLLAGIPAKINLLPYNPCRTDQPELRRPTDDSLDRFAESLRDAGITVTVRQSRGLDIAAACGQLALASATEDPSTQSRS